VQQTSDGGYIIAGTTASYGAGSDDFWLIKTDASGGQVWAQTFGGTGWDDGSEVSQTSDGGYIIVGTTSSYGAGSSDIWLIKTDAFGNQTWAKTFGGTGDDQGYSVRQTSDGGYVIVGQTDSYGAGGIDIWLIKTDASGNQIWTKTFGGWTDDYGYSVRQTSDGGYIIVGETDSYGGGNGDAYLIKTDVSGTQVWTRTFGGANSDAGYSVQQTPDGGYILVGQTSSYVDVDSGDVYVVKTDASGNQVWARTVGGAHPDYGNSVQLAASGGYIIAGSTFSYGAGGQDVWLIKTDADGNTVMSSRPFASSRLNRHDGQTSSSARPSVRAPLGQTHPYGRARRIRGE
jgi:predicted secreted protein